MELPKRLARGSGANKLGAMRTMRALGRLGVLRLLKPWLKQGPPFYYFRGLNETTLEQSWRNLLRTDMHDAAIDEYIQAHLPHEVAELREMTLQSYPVHVIAHDPAVMAEEIVKYGGLTHDEAVLVDELWQSLIREAADASKGGQLLVAEGSSHYPQFAQPAMVLHTIVTMIRDCRRVSPS